MGLRVISGEAPREAIEFVRESVRDSMEGWFKAVLVSMGGRMGTIGSEGEARL